MFDLIYKYCEVIADRTVNGARFVFFKEDGFGVVQTDISDEGELLSFSCSSMEEFEGIIDSLVA